MHAVLTRLLQSSVPDVTASSSGLLEGKLPLKEPESKLTTNLIALAVSILLCGILSLLTHKYYIGERNRINDMLKEAEEKILSSILIIDYEGDETTRNSNNLRNKMNKIIKKELK